MKLTEGFNLLATAPDGIKRLRELILTLAVQGKLVSQDPNDEPASELLKQICTEKDRLIAEGKIKKDKPLAAITDEEKPFELPEGWEWVRFGEILDFQGGGQPPKSKFSEVELPDYVRLIQIRDLGDKPQPVFIPRSEGSKFCSASDIMVGRYGASVGKIFWGIKGAYNVALVKMIDEWGCFEPTYLHTLLTSPVGQSWFKGISRSAQDGFNKNDISPNLVPLAPRLEQSRIVAKVEELMALCDALETRGKLEAKQHARLTATLFDALAASDSAHQLQENWTRLAQSFDLILDRPAAVDALEQTLLQLAVRGLLVEQDPKDQPASELLKQIRAEKDRLIAEGKIKKDKPLPAITDEEKPFDLPLGWEWVRLQQVGKCFDYGTSQKAFEIPHGTPVLRMGNVQAGRVRLSGLKYFQDNLDELPSLFLRKRDLLFNRTNSYELVGKTGIFDGEDNVFSFASYLIRIRLLGKHINAEYVNYYMNSLDCRANEIEPNVVQQNGQANFNGTKMKNIRLPLPPLAEQSRIVARVEALRALCAQLRERLTASQKIQTHLAETLVGQSG